MADILTRRDGKTMKAMNATTDIKATIDSIKPQNINRAIQAGFNTVINCRWCGEKAKELYIPQYKDGKDGKPVEIIYNYEPCDKCKNAWKDMVVIIEVTEQELYKDCLPIDIEMGTKLYPTGRHIGVTKKAARESIDKNIENGMVFFMEKITFDEIFNKYFKK